MSETLMNTAIRADGDRRAGTVGRAAAPASTVRLVDDNGNELDVSDDETVGEIQVRGPNLFLEYLNRPDATEEAMNDGWFATGDVATRSEDGYIRIVGRRATDLIKSGGYKIGAGEIENALLEHPARGRGGGHRRAGSGPRRADHRLDRRRGLRQARREGTRRPRRAPADPAQAAARGPLSGRAPAQRDGEGHQENAARLNPVKSAPFGPTTRGNAGQAHLLIATVVALVAIAASAGIAALHLHADERRTRYEILVELESSANRVDALESEANAERRVPLRVQAELSALLAHMRAELEGLERRGSEGAAAVLRRLRRATSR